MDNRSISWKINDIHWDLEPDVIEYYVCYSIEKSYFQIEYQLTEGASFGICWETLSICCPALIGQERPAMDATSQRSRLVEMKGILSITKFTFNCPPVTFSSVEYHYHSLMTFTQIIFIFCQVILFERLEIRSEKEAKVSIIILLIQRQGRDRGCLY